MVDGVILKLDTSKAVEAQKQFEQTTRGTFVALDEQGKHVTDLESQMRAMASATEAAAQAQQKLSTQRPAAAAGSSQQDRGFGFGSSPETARIAQAEAALRAEASLRRQKEATDAAASATGLLDRESRKAAVGIDATGKSSNATTQFLTKLLNATGATGAAKGFSLLASGAKALVTSINPIGIATGIAAAAVLTFATELLAAETNAQKLERQLLETQNSFDLTAAAASRTASALQSIGDGFSGFDLLGDTEAQVQALEAQLNRIKQARRDFVTDVQRSGGTLTPTIQEINALGEALGKPPSFFIDLQDAARGSQQAIERLKKDGVELSLGLLTVSPEKLVAELDKLEANTKARLESAKATQAQQKLSSEERKKAAKEAEDAEKALFEAAKKFDEQNRKRRADEAADALLQEQRLAAFDREKASIERETQLIGASAGEREKLRVQMSLEAKAREVSADFLQQEREAIERTAQAVSDAIDLEDQRTRAQQEAREASDRLARSEQDRVDILRQVREDTDILLASTEKERRAKETLAKLNDALTRTETQRGTAAAKELEDAFRRLDEATDFSERRQELTALGEETFGAIGQNIVSAVQNGANFRQFLGGVAQDLAQIAAQRFIIDALARLGGTLFGSAARPPAQSAQPGSLSTFYGYGNTNALGSVVPSGAGSAFAAQGLILDRFQTFTRGGQRVTTNEGGAATPEAIVPLQRDQYGRLGVSAAGSGQTVIVNVPNVRSGEEARRIRPTLRQTVEAVGRAQGRTRSGGLRGGR